MATIVPVESKPARFTARNSTFMQVNSSIIITDIMIIITVSSNYFKTAVVIIPPKELTTTTTIKVFVLWGIIYQLPFHFGDHIYHNYYFHFHYQQTSTAAAITKP